MGRAKAAPTKNKSQNENWVLDKPLDYIPIKKKKTQRLVQVKTKDFNLKLATEEHRKYFLGALLIGTTQNILLETYKTCTVTFQQNEENENLSLLLQCDSITAIIEIICEIQLLKTLVNSNIFHFNVTSNEGEVFFELYFTKLPLPKFTKTISSLLIQLFSLFYNIQAEDSDKTSNILDPTSSETIEELYKSVKSTRERHLKLTQPETISHNKLKPVLRPYQQDAVRWMLHRENKLQENTERVHPLFTVVTLKSGLEIYFNKFTGFIETSKPTIHDSVRGGILADEMGLGKTVEVFACILLNSDETNESEERDSDEINIISKPTIEKISRKRKHNSEKIEKPEKEAKISEDAVTASITKNSKKTPMRLQLEKWYSETLQSTVPKRAQPPASPSIQCSCGNDHEENTIVCTECSKIQHSFCMGYSKELGPYLCPQCWTQQPLLASKATLIVAPLTLRAQWCSEICKHIKGGFRVLQYEASHLTSVYPTKLQHYDVVITSYNVLQAELRLTEVEKEVNFRHQRKYSPPGSPLTRIMWRRVCLDEAQTVESPTSMVSAMAQKLNARFRWAVTGTPISKQVSDLYGLLEYLEIEPFNDKFIWMKSLYEPYLRGEGAAMEEFLSRVLWRSSKSDIIDQINIPPQEVREHWLSFSAIEQYFYKMEHDLNRFEFLEKMKKFNLDETLKTLNKHTLKKLLLPLVALRQVCTYPNSVRTRYLSTKKPVNSMKELLDALIAKNLLESEEHLRVVLSCLNGLAGIYQLLGDSEEAVAQYREVLQLYARFTEEERGMKLSVDKLPIIHAMHNLAELLEAHSSVGKSLRDESLRRDCRNLEEKYLEKFAGQSVAALNEFKSISEGVEKLQDGFRLDAAQWYCDLLNWIYLKGFDGDLEAKIVHAHEDANIQYVQNYRNKQSLQFFITKWDEEISSARDATIDAVKNLFSYTSSGPSLNLQISKTLVEKARDCHLRPEQEKPAKKQKKCKVCQANAKLKDYEFKLFTMTKRNASLSDDSSDASLKGSWKPRTEELIFKSLVAVAKNKNAEDDAVFDGQNFVTILETMKKEFKELRKLWTFLDQQASALDELDMCKMRLQLAQRKTESVEEKAERRNKILKSLSYVVENRLERIHLVKQNELEFHRASLINERVGCMALLEKNMGVRNYLQTLNKQYYEGQTPDPCPICKNNLEKHWNIVPCGHNFCLDCMQLLIKKNNSDKIQCSVCRALHAISDISFIKQGQQPGSAEAAVIRGNYSTKIEGVIRLILDLSEREENVKILIFSTWIPVLRYLEEALKNNLILYELLTSTNIEKQIDSFKSSKATNVLLLPVKLGGKGLNLTEATHVVLIEPLLNRGEELQAIGRVHRIGQTKKTVVHKFYVRNTLEETIYKATSSNSQSWEKNRVTLRQLTDLFTEPVAPEVEEEDVA